MKDNKPHCDICGHKHYRRDPHIWDDKPSEPIKEAAPEPKKPKFDRLACHREAQRKYMRKWRARQKAAKAANHE